jgi:hypothetical protein
MVEGFHVRIKALLLCGVQIIVDVLSTLLSELFKASSHLLISQDSLAWYHI